MAETTQSEEIAGAAVAVAPFSDSSVTGLDTASPRPQAVAPSLLDYPATYLLIGLNLAVYLVMARLGPLPRAAGAAIPTGITWHHAVEALTRLLTQPFDDRLLIAFGSCVPVRVLHFGEWWRLITSTFVHVTLLHLLLNMWCLWNLGIFGERLLGKPGLVAVYLLTGAAGMLQSVLLSGFTGQQDAIIAGASGAVFGIAGILIVLLSNRRLAAPWRELRSLRRQVVFFAVANLVLGGVPDVLPRLVPGMLRTLHMTPSDLPNVANGAHLGGFVCGFLLGMPLFPRMTSGRSTYRARQVLVFSSAAMLLVLMSYSATVFVRGR